MTQRLVDGEPAPFGGETIQVGALDSYEARCRSCHSAGEEAGQTPSSPPVAAPLPDRRGARVGAWPPRLTRARSRSPGTATRSCSAGNARRSSRARGSTPAAPSSGRRAGLVPHDGRRRRADPRHTRPARRAPRVRERLPPPRRGADGRLRPAQHAAVPATTRGPTTSTARCEARRAPSASRSSTTTTGRCSPRASARGARSSSSTPTRLRSRSPTTSATCRRSSRARSTSTSSSSTHASSSAPNANWKIVVENFLECYHCPTAHPVVQRRGRRPPGPLPARGAPDVRGAVRPGEEEPASAGSSTCSSRTPASTSSPARANLSIGPIAPAGPAAPSATSTTSSPQALDDDWIATSSPSTTRSGARTRALVESVHRGMASGMLEHGRLLLNAEPLLAAFQRWVGAGSARRRIVRTPRQPTGGTL